MRPPEEAADVCIIGSGAGGAPVALRAAQAGLSVIVLEKGPALSEVDFSKDEIGECRRNKFTPRLRDEPHVVELPDGKGGWSASPTFDTPGWNLWNACMVGGATNLMSGFFYRLKPIDFRLRSELGPIEGANIADWPIGYDDLEPYYALVEREVGVSGRVEPHPFADRRSTPRFPYPPLEEHPTARWLDEVCTALGLHPFPVPRAILSTAIAGRGGCSYSGYCAAYGCATGAKGSARAALLGRAVATGRCQIRPRAMVHRIESDAKGRAVAADYFDHQGEVRRVTARVFVVAAQAIETARLLLLSTGPRHPRGLANRSGLVGQNLLFSASSSAVGDLRRGAGDPGSSQPFVNRALQDWYIVDDRRLKARRKGGTVHFLLAHPNPIDAALSLAYERGGPVWGDALKARMVRYFRATRRVTLECFADWMPTPDTRVQLDPHVRDRWGLPVARVKISTHPRSDLACADLCARGADVLRQLGAEGVREDDVGPSVNLAAGTCRFGLDPRSSVLDRDCRAHDVDNLFVTDGSFMPTGGSVPYTWTIYANAFRVADVIVKQLGARG